MVQGEKYGSQASFDTSPFGGQLDAAAKRSKFLSLQKADQAKGSAPAASSTNRQSATNSNWGPFKDRNDFVNMHFS